MLTVMKWKLLLPGLLLANASVADVLWHGEDVLLEPAERYIYHYFESGDGVYTDPAVSEYWYPQGTWLEVDDDLPEPDYDWPVDVTL